MPTDPTRKTPAKHAPEHAPLEDAKSRGPRLRRGAEACAQPAPAETIGEWWRRENAKAFASSNRWVDQEGLPLARYRQF
ncbi:type II toxin-antitoxin system CcdA family antitoxin [Ciceribacter thiooxidans]|uniref:Type II toxin-antitoxin system CcdA family antitoxin n=1 Tax=Ciceribacter thiooxidans TaxID=1969821 RepID=A0ABV7I2K3_9HYPH|nr:type II toxin-antitoxin system CcdA family antitoxin [Ciceribacter thiooxidans]